MNHWKIEPRKKPQFWERQTVSQQLTVFCFNLQLSLDLYYTEDEIYELSYAREPRNHRAPVSFSS
jgi:hypothetical protein